MTLVAKFGGHSAGTFGGPKERRLRVAPCGRFNQGLQVAEDDRIILLDKMPAAAGGSNPLGRQLFLGMVRPSLKLAPTGPNRSPGQTRSFGHDGRAAATQPLGLTSSPLTTHSFRHQRLEELVFGAHSF
jgi:hypothetical protein